MTSYNNHLWILRTWYHTSASTKKDLELEPEPILFSKTTRLHPQVFLQKTLLPIIQLHIKTLQKLITMDFWKIYHSARWKLINKRPPLELILQWATIEITYINQLTPILSIIPISNITSKTLEEAEIHLTQIWLMKLNIMISILHLT